MRGGEEDEDEEKLAKEIKRLDEKCKKNKRRELLFSTFLFIHSLPQDFMM